MNQIGLFTEKQWAVKPPQLIFSPFAKQVKTNLISICLNTGMLAKTL